MYHATIKERVFDVETNADGKSGALNGNPFELDIHHSDKNHFHVIMNHRSFNVEVVKTDRELKMVELKVNGRNYSVQLKDRYDDLLKSLGMENSGLNQHRDVKAPMPGMVLSVLVNAGVQVEKDTPLVILEAMKMENVIKSPGSGLIKRVIAQKGIAVEKNSVLVEFE